MALPVEKLRKELLALSADDRALLAHELIGSLEDPSHFMLDPDTEKEIQRRLNSIQSGQANFIPAAQVFKNVEGKFN